jgi:hypothetical protein
MKNFISFIIYTDPVTQRIYTHNVFPDMLPNNQVCHQFIINYSSRKVKDRLHNDHCKISSGIDYNDWEAFHTGGLHSIINQYDMCVYYPSWNRRFLSAINNEENLGVFLN